MGLICAGVQRQCNILGGEGWAAPWENDGIVTGNGFDLRVVRWPAEKSSRAETQRRGEEGGHS
jgi:hypothetical protein